MDKYYTIECGDNVFFGKEINGALHGIVFCPYEEARTIVRTTNTVREGEVWVEISRQECAEAILANILFDIEFHGNAEVQKLKDDL